MNRRNLILLSSNIATFALISQSATSQRIYKGTTVNLGEKLTGYYVFPNTKRALSAVIVLIEGFGLNAYIRDVCDRFAKAGYAALAPDIYHGESFAYSDVQKAVTKLKSMDDEMVMAEVAKSLSFLARQKEVNAEKIGTIGFCMGGRFAFLASAMHPKMIKSTVCFYGGGIAANPDPFGRKALLDRVPLIQHPVMLVYGAEDSLIAAEEHQRIALALSTSKKRYVLNVFPNAGHGFFSDRRENYAPVAAVEAWQNTLNFFQKNLS